MKEYNIIVEIDENGNIKAETKGMSGKVCINELDEILDGLIGERSFKNKSEFYKKDFVVRKTINNKQ